MCGWAAPSSAPEAESLLEHPNHLQPRQPSRQPAQDRLRQRDAALCPLQPTGDLPCLMQEDCRSAPLHPPGDVPIQDHQAIIQPIFPFHLLVGNGVGQHDRPVVVWGKGGIAPAIARSDRVPERPRASGAMDPVATKAAVEHGQQSKGSRPIAFPLAGADSR